MHEFSKFCASLKVIRYTGDKASRRSLRGMVYEHVLQHSSSKVSRLVKFVLFFTFCAHFLEMLAV